MYLYLFFLYYLCADINDLFIFSSKSLIIKDLDIMRFVFSKPIQICNYLIFNVFELLV